MSTVSVLMTAFNRARFIGESIRSVRASSFTDWELIVVDDASEDDTLRAAREAASGDARIRIHANERNLGDYPNRNRAASLAGGTYLKYLDSDDRLAPDGLRSMVECMERHPEVALGLCDTRAEPGREYPYVLPPEEAYRAEFLGRGVLGVGPTGTILRRDAFEAAGGFRVPRWLGDWDLWLRLACRAPVAVLRPDLVAWREHDRQEIASPGAERFYLQHGYEVAVRHLGGEECPLQADDRRRAWDRLKQHHARRILRTVFRRLRLRSGWQAFRASGLTWRELARGLRPYDGVGRSGR